MKAKEFTSVVQSLSLGILLASCSLFSTTLNAEVKAVKLGHSFSDAHPRAIAMKKFAADVESATDVKLRLLFMVMLFSDLNSKCCRQHVAMYSNSIWEPFLHLQVFRNNFKYSTFHFFSPLTRKRQKYLIANSAINY
ncbi:predicted C4-decarboxylate transport system, periplasmic component, N-terminal part [Escherichia albertii]|nr:predicted C4-decarboxylate transport system, periplasmic component, N-terminal part [Escherichia albertii]